MSNFSYPAAHNLNGMTRKQFIYTLASVFLCVFLSSCELGQLKKDDDQLKIDILETEKLAAQAYEREDLIESEKYYTVLVREVPQEILPWFRLGNIYARTKRPEVAITAYKEALIRDPKYANAWYNMAIVQLKQAASSFNEMQIYTDPSHPLHKRSKEAFEGILELIKGKSTDE